MSNRRLIIKIILWILTGSIVLGVFFGAYLKNIALNNLAQRDAKKTSELIFEVMKTKMQEGWSKKDLDKIMKRLNSLKEGLVIKSYRSKKVAELFGEDNKSSKAIKTDRNIQQAMKGKEILQVGKNDSIHFYYPIIAQKSCLKCHTNAKEGDINGVLDIYFPTNQISIPLYTMVEYLLLFFITFLVIVFLIFYYILDKKISSPLVKLTKQIKNDVKANNFKNKIEIDTQIAEINQLKEAFNELLDRIQFYYQQMINQFYTDQMTNLPNLLSLKKDLSKFNNPTLTVININQFRNLNEFYGYEICDRILVELSDILKEGFNDDVKTYRIGGDEFAWLTEGMINLYRILEILEKIQAHSFNYRDSEIYITLTCGIAEGRENILRNANIALYKAKKSSKPLEIYHASIEKESKINENIIWTQKLRDALNDDRIIVYFQPILDITLARADKFETLVRLKDNNGKIYPPALFMDAAKFSRLYLRLTRVIAKKAFNYFRDKPYEFSINIAMEDIADNPTKNYILNLLKEFPEPSRVVFEILETEEIREVELMLDFVKKVKAYGAKIAIDDFGSGYSNYDYVIKLDVDFLKIDSSLVKNIDKNSNMRDIVKSIIELSRKLGIKTIAEYVSSKDILDIVKELGIDYVQGYYIDKPLQSINEHTKKGK